MGQKISSASEQQAGRMAAARAAALAGPPRQRPIVALMTLTPAPHSFSAAQKKNRCVAGPG